MREQEEDDKKRWEGIDYKNTAEKLRREAEEFEAQQATWRESLKMKRRI